MCAGSTSCWSCAAATCCAVPRASCDLWVSLLFRSIRSLSSVSAPPATSRTGGERPPSLLDGTQRDGPPAPGGFRVGRALASVLRRAAPKPPLGAPHVRQRHDLGPELAPDPVHRPANLFLRLPRLLPHQLHPLAQPVQLVLHLDDHLHPGEVHPFLGEPLDG